MIQLAESARSACKNASVLIVGGDAAARSELRTGLSRYVGLVDSAGTAQLAEELIARCHFDVLVVDASLESPSAL
ncbi:MAG: sigma-54-dependent Fis family transcriptional regulator, partial [Anaerolineae bacterium]